MKKLILILGLLLLPNLIYAGAPSRTKTYTTGEIISPSDVTENEDNIFRYVQTGVDTYADGTIVNADISGSAAITYGKLSLSSSILTGDITDGTIVNADISSSAAITDSKLAQITTASKVSATAITGGVVLPSGALFYMITGSCPSGTTDVTTTYSDKFVRINATQGSTGGSDTVTIAEANLPSHTHAAGTLAAANESSHKHAGLEWQGSGSGSTWGFTVEPGFDLDPANTEDTGWNTPNADSSGLGTTSIRTGAGDAHAHTLSGSTGAIGSGTATTITNPYITAKCCQVD